MQVIRLGSRCNNACVFCAAAAERERDEAEPSLESLLELIEAIDAQVVAFVGGEPTLYDDLPSLVQAVKRQGSRVVVQTNARRLAYPSYASVLADAGVDALDVSLHGYTPAMHDYHTSVEGSFRQTLRGASQGVATGMHLVMSCVVTRSNFRNLAEIVGVAQAAGAKSIRFQAPRLSGRALSLRDRVVAHSELVMPYLRKAVAFGRRHRVDVVVGLPRETGDFVPFVADQVEPAPRLDEPAESRVLSCRAQPGRGERRVHSHQSGTALREILPALFDATQEGR